MIQIRNQINNNLLKLQPKHRKNLKLSHNNNNKTVKKNNLPNKSHGSNKIKNLKSIFKKMLMMKMNYKLNIKRI